MQMAEDIHALNEKVSLESRFVEGVVREVSGVIVGQREMVERLLIGLLCNGHVLIEGVPGLAKTLTINTLARTIDATFQRIQFTPDLLPADLIGTMIYQQSSGEFIPKKGPIFSQLVLADEVNRAPAKVQSAMLEAMQERQVTIGGQTFLMEDPFLVLATQNPIEQEGTYPLPEAQVDRFMIKIEVTYPSRQEERAIVDRMGGGPVPSATALVSPDDIRRARSVVDEIYVDGKLKDYIVDLVLATRDPGKYGLEDLVGLIEYGCSPRGSIFMTKAAKAHAFLRGRGYATPEDVKAVGVDIMRHRIIVTYEAEAEEITPEAMIQRIFEKIEVP